MYFQMYEWLNASNGRSLDVIFPKDVQSDNLAQNPDKAAASNDKGKMNVDNCIDLSDDKLKEFMEAEDSSVTQKNNHLPFNKTMEDFVKDEEQEVDSEEDIIPLQVIQLDRVVCGKEESEELAQIRFKEISKILVGHEGPSSQPTKNPLW